jgi:heme-degrading monooxygenase HmoA
MSKPVIETVNFQLVENTPEDVFLTAAQQSSEFLRTCPGFQARQVSRGAQSDLWLDLVFWENMGFAVDAALRFNTSPHTVSFNNLLKEGTVSMAHFEVKARVER